MTTITKIDDNKIEVSTEVKQVYNKDRLLLRKAQLEKVLLEINNLLKEFQ